MALSLLKAELTRAGTPCDLRYFSITFAAHVGVSSYLRVSALTGTPEALAGEWIFAHDLFGDRIPPAEAYLRDALRPTLTSQKNSIPLPLDTQFDLASDFLRIRECAAPFLEDCIAAVDWDNYALVGFTVTHQQLVASLALARRIAERHPQVKIIFGGANCDDGIGIAIHRLFSFVDYVCLGNGDLNFPILAQRLLNEQPIGDIAGVVQRGEDGQTILPTILSTPMLDMDALPFPDQDDFLAQWESAHLQDKLNPYFLIETSRGCWWGQKMPCSFCGLSGSSFRYRSKSAQRVMEEFTYLAHKYGKGARILAVDCIMDMNYFRDVLPRLAESHFDISLYYEVKSNLNKRQVRQLKEAGIVEFQPGIESLSTKTLALMRKGVTMLQNIQFLRWCAEFMMRPYWNLLFGFPGEDPLEYARQSALLPWIAHLPPPADCVSVALDRFSPLWAGRETNGLCNVRATKAMQYIFPFAPDDLMEVARFFDFDYVDGRNPQEYIRDLKRGAEFWRDLDNHSELSSSVKDDMLIIHDTRPVAKQELHQYVGSTRAVYEYCDQARSRARIKAHIDSRNLNVDESALDNILSEFIEEKLMIEEDGLYLSLAVDSAYRVRWLAQRIKFKSAPP